MSADSLFDWALGLCALMCGVSTYLYYKHTARELEIYKAPVPRLGMHKEIFEFIRKERITRKSRESNGAKVALYAGFGFLVWFVLFMAEALTPLPEYLFIAVAASFLVRCFLGIHYFGLHTQAKLQNLSRSTLQYIEYIHVDARKKYGYKTSRKVSKEPDLPLGELNPEIRGSFNAPVLKIYSRMAVQSADNAVVSQGDKTKTKAKMPVVALERPRLWEPEQSRKAALALVHTGQVPADGSPVLVVWLDSSNLASVFVGKVEKSEACDLTAMPESSKRAFRDITGGGEPPFAITVADKVFVGAQVALCLESTEDKQGLGWIVTPAAAPALLSMLVWLEDSQRQVLNELINPGKPIA